MTPKQTRWRTFSLLPLGFCAGVAITCASAQELETGNNLIGPTSSIPSNTGVPRLGALENSNAVTVQKSQASSTWPPPELQGRPNPLWAIPMQSLTATRERPIFSPSRRPPPPVSLAAPQQQPAQKNEPDRPLLTLIGTVAEGGDGIAVFRDESTKNILRMQTGESHLGWTLSTVSPREVTMARNHDTATLAIPSPPAK
jgi:general secretion pathway protein N